MTLIHSLHVVLTIWLIYKLCKAYIGLQHYRKVKNRLVYYKHKSLVYEAAFKIANNVLIENNLPLVTIEEQPCQPESTILES